jgi:DNA-binding beta-propeller fold protein YncE
MFSGMRVKRETILGVCIAATVAACATHPAPQPGSTSATCNDPPAGGSTNIETPGNPFQALPSADGCWVFVSLSSGTFGSPTGIGVYRRAGGRLQLARTVGVQGGATGMTITHGGALLVVAAGPRVAFLDVSRLTSGRGDPVLGYLIDGRPAGRIYANTTPDDRLLFVADERAQTISVIDLPRARATGFSNAATIGHIPTGGAPIALALSPDAKWMYATSQVAPANYQWPIECKREGSPTNDPTPVVPQGAIHIIDVERAKTDPAAAVVGSVPAGCSAVRLVLSPSGSRAYVSARNSNMLLVFDVAKLHSDPAHARIGAVPVGSSPVGIAVVDGGRKVIVTNSNRFAGGADDHQSLTVIDAAKAESGAGAAAITGSIPAGAFPREMRVTPDGKTLILTNFGSRTIQLIDVR